MMAMLKAKKVDAAFEWYRKMQSAEVMPDPPLYR